MKKLNINVNFKKDKIHELTKDALDVFMEMESKSLSDVSVDMCMADWITVLLITHDILEFGDAK